MKKIHIVALLFVIFLASCLPAAPAEPLLNGAPGEVLYREDFSNNTSGWDRVLNDGGIMDYDSGGYRILVRGAKMNFWSTPPGNFGDVRIEADVTRLNGPMENRAGLICRYQNGNYYFFVISNDGYYAIGKFTNGQAILIGQEMMVASDAIREEEVNHLRADCAGDTLTFYVNETQVASTQDPDFATGGVGVLAGSFDEPGVDVLFQNFVVFQP
ncbi:MAG: hypothetical protein HRF47_17480 [Chloroflexota bacterium]|jgi:hypothetical protein